MAIVVENVTRGAIQDNRLVTRQEFQQAADSGLLGDANCLELVDGEVIRRVTQNGPHVTTARRMETALWRILPDGFIISIEKPLAIDNFNQLQPDIAVVRGVIDDFEMDHPSTAELVLEIAYSSLIVDRIEKAGLYARAGVREYWIVNLRDGTLELHRDPIRDDDVRFGARYQQVRTLERTDAVSPLFAPSATFVVGSFLPRLMSV